MSVKCGNAIVEKENGERGEVPTYFLELDDVPGETFAEQIEYVLILAIDIQKLTSREYTPINCILKA